MSVDLNLGDTRLLIEECERHGLLRNQAAYCLATAYWETARTMEPVREAFWLSDDWRRRNLRYYPWYGRGYVQITWEANYERLGKRLDLDLTTDPDVVMRADTAAKILVVGMLEGLFTGKKLSDYVTLKASNYRGARRIVNGTDKANAIAEIARDYEGALVAIGYGVEPAAPVINERRDGSAPRGNPATSTTLQATLATILATISNTSQAAKDAVASVTDSFGVSPEFALTAIALLGAAWIFRERLKKWTQGDR